VSCIAAEKHFDLIKNFILNYFFTINNVSFPITVKLLLRLCQNIQQWKNYLSFISEQFQNVILDMGNPDVFNSEN